MKRLLLITAAAIGTRVERPRFPSRAAARAIQRQGRRVSGMRHRPAYPG